MWNLCPVPEGEVDPFGPLQSWEDLCQDQGRLSFLLSFPLSFSYTVWVGHFRPVFTDFQVTILLTMEERLCYSSLNQWPLGRVKNLLWLDLDRDFPGASVIIRLSVKINLSGLCGNGLFELDEYSEAVILITSPEHTPFVLVFLSNQRGIL